MRIYRQNFLARRPTLGQRGLTLVEVLIAMVILSLALLTYLTITQASDAAISEGSEFTIASQAVGNQIAQDQGLGYSGLTNGTTITTVAGLSSGQMTVVIGALDGSTANVGIKQIDITISWKPRKVSKLAQTTSIKETTLVCNR